MSVRSQLGGARLDAEIVVHRAEFTVEASLHIGAGETLAIMGPSGAGKSTIVQVLAVIQRFDAGHITLGERRLAAPGLHLPPQQRGVGLLGQRPRLFPHLTAAENIAFAGRASGLDRVAARADALDWLDRVELTAAADRRPNRLSGGQAQRVALARSLAARPQLLLLDEPFTSLDVEVTLQMRELLATQLKATGMSVVLVSHDGRDALMLADQLIVIERGSTVQHGAVREVLAAPRTSFARAVAASLTGLLKPEPEPRPVSEERR